MCTPKIQLRIGNQRVQILQTCPCGGLLSCINRHDPAPFAARVEKRTRSDTERRGAPPCHAVAETPPMRENVPEDEPFGEIHDTLHGVPQPPAQSRMKPLAVSER